MGRNLDDILKSLPTERRKKIEALSEKKVEEMIALAATLTDFRKAVGKTQVEVADELGVKQNAVSQLEKRSDLYLSTLRRFLKSVGMTLELAVITPNGKRISLPGFLQTEGDDPMSTIGTALDAPKRVTRVFSRPRNGTTKSKKRLLSSKRHGGEHKIVRNY